MTTRHSRHATAELSEEANTANLEAKLEKVLRDARTRVAPWPMSTEESVRAGIAAMQLGRENAARTLLERIASYALVSEEEFMKRVGVSSDWIANSLADRWLFAFRGSDEVRYFLTFYGDTTVPWAR